MAKGKKGKARESVLQNFLLMKNKAESTIVIVGLLLLLLVLMALS